MTLDTKGFRSGFVSIVGRPNVGKSTLLNALLGQKIAIASDKPQTTRNRILGIYTRETTQILFLDTPGIHRAKGRLNKFMVDQALSTCKGVDAVLFLVEATDRPGGGDDYILDLLAKGKAPVILGINKADLVAKTDLLPLIAAYAEKLDFAGILPLSGLKGEGVDELITLVQGILPEGPHYYPEDMITDQPERFIVAEMIREQLLKQTHDEVPYGVAVAVERFTEKTDKNLVVIEAVIHVEREAHKSIVIGKKGAKLKTIGQAARFDIERMLGTRVFLELFVRVEKNWTQSNRLLKEFGYE
ncbi:MAG: GTPase Era [Desulfuromonadales bacterium C00003096]|nr:MAG: GTPase Era [Desulfuromonadales bacterium C00003096]